MVLFARQLSISRKRLISNDKRSCTAQSYLVWRVDLWSMAQGSCLKSQERIRTKITGRCLVDNPFDFHGRRRRSISRGPGKCRETSGWRKYELFRSILVDTGRQRKTLKHDITALFMGEEQVLS
jgi:hypothetical protein